MHTAVHICCHFCSVYLYKAKVHPKKESLSSYCIFIIMVLFSLWICISKCIRMLNLCRGGFINHIYKRCWTSYAVVNISLHLCSVIVMKCVCRITSALVFLSFMLVSMDIINLNGLVFVFLFSRDVPLWYFSHDMMHYCNLYCAYIARVFVHFFIFFFVQHILTNRALCISATMLQ